MDNLYITPLEILRRMFAASTAFQTLTGAAAANGKTAAEVAYDTFTLQEFETWPDLDAFVITGYADDALSGARDCQGGGIRAFKQSINFYVNLVVDTKQAPESDAWFAAGKSFMATAADILEDVLELSGTDGYFLFSTYQASRAFRSEHKKDSGLLYIVFEFTTGV